MTTNTNTTVPTIAELRSRIAEGLSADLLTGLPRLTTMRIHANGAERVPMFLLASACRFLAPPMEQNAQNAEDGRVAEASERFTPAADALLAGVERALAPAEMYELLDRFVGASAAANRTLSFGEGISHP